MAYVNDGFQLTEKNGKLENSNAKEQRSEDESPADFETAITAAKWGKFNILIYIVAFVTGWTAIFETTTMSYVFPAAECDLDLKLYHKGLLNAVTYTGMISSAFMWGFLCDTLGRKKLLVIGALLDGVFVLMSASSQNFALLMTAKFFGGFIINGPFAALTAYVSEFHCSKHRARVQMVLGTSMSCGTLLLPTLAMGIMPLDLEWWISNHFALFGFRPRTVMKASGACTVSIFLENFVPCVLRPVLEQSHTKPEQQQLRGIQDTEQPKIVEGKLSIAVLIFFRVMHSWNMYLLVCALPSLTSGVCMIFLPESPKFLMTTGRNEQALRIFRMVYRINTGKSEDTYPIKKLVDETAKNDDNKHGGKVTANRSKKKALTEGWQQIKPLFFPPHLLKILLVCCLQFLIMMSLNTLRLWLPQVFQAITDYKANHNESATLCTMIAIFQDKHNLGNASQINIEEPCTVNHNNIDVYTNSMIVSAVTISGYVVAGTLINAVGKKKLLCTISIVSGSMAICIYFARNVATTITLASLFVASGSIAINVVLAIVVDLFPTTLRTMTVSMTMMLGRSGAVIGNLFFPLLLATGCAPPFLFVGSAIIACSLLACLLPDTDQKALE